MEIKSQTKEEKNTDKKSVNKNEISNIDEINKLKIELEEEKRKNKILQNTIIDLNNTINQLKQKYDIENKKYNKEIKTYSKKIELMNNDIQKITLENNNLKNEIKKVNEQINSNKTVKMLKLKIEELNEKFKRYPFNLEEGERMFSIIFASSTMNYSMICKNTDTINKLEKELYQEYPELSKSNNFYLCKGINLDKNEKLEKFHLKNSDIIIVNQSEF